MREPPVEGSSTALPRMVSFFWGFGPVALGRSLNFGSLFNGPV